MAVATCTSYFFGCFDPSPTIKRTKGDYIPIRVRTSLIAGLFAAAVCENNRGCLARRVDFLGDHPKRYHFAFYSIGISSRFLLQITKHQKQTSSLPLVDFYSITPQETNENITYLADGPRVIVGRVARQQATQWLTLMPLVSSIDGTYVFGQG